MIGIYTLRTLSRKTQLLITPHRDAIANTATMADTNPPAQPAAAENAPNLHLDEVTGERVSKSELKKRQKQREVCLGALLGVDMPLTCLGREEEGREGC